MTPYRRQIGTRLNSTVAQGLGSHSNTVKSHRVKSTSVKTNRHQLKPIDTHHRYQTCKYSNGSITQKNKKDPKKGHFYF